MCCPRPSRTTAPRRRRSFSSRCSCGLIFFFLLEKAELYRHSHHHQGDGHHHHHFDAEAGGAAVSSCVLMGDSIHNFCDGIIIAAAFLTDTHLGLVTALAIIAHEIPQEVGDYIVLLNAGLSRSKALMSNAISGLGGRGRRHRRLFRRGAVGGAVSLPAGGGEPSSFIYVAVADLIPQLHGARRWRETACCSCAWFGSRPCPGRGDRGRSPASTGSLVGHHLSSNDQHGDLAMGEDFLSLAAQQ